MKKTPSTATGTADVRSLWVKRALVASGIGIATATLAHGLAGGALPAMGGFVPPFIFATLLSLVLLRRHSLPGLVASVVLSQWVFHQTSAWTVGAVAHTHHHAPVIPVLTDSASGMGGFHGVAAVVTGFFVILADRGFAATLRASAYGTWSSWLSRRLMGETICPPHRVRSAGVVTRMWTPVGRLVLRAHPSRGPPVFSFS